MKRSLLATLILIASTQSLANNYDFKPAGTIGIEYSLLNIETESKLKAQYHMVSGGYNWYYNNNLSFHLSLGTVTGEEDMETSDGSYTFDDGKVSFIASTDLRLEIPMSNELALYTLFGATYIDFETTQYVLDEEFKSIGLKAGVGASYVLSRESAIYVEYRQDIISTEFNANTFSIGYKFVF
jgi:opacity protein-like surface antigen